MATSLPTTVGEWFVNLPEAGRDEARRCLMTGAYSRRLIASLREAFPLTPEHQHGLDDPRAVQAGDPLGANLQTLLRERFLSPVGAGAIRYHGRARALTAVTDHPGRDSEDDPALW